MKSGKIGLLLGLTAAIVICCVTVFYHSGPKTAASPYGALSKTDTIYLEVEKDTVTPTSLTYRICNRTGEELYYGVDYEIEMYQDGGWQSFDVDAAWIEIAVALPANNNNEEAIDWANIYGELPKGKYRLIKTVNNLILGDTFEI